MRYLIIMPGHVPFFTEYFDPENHFVPGMTAIDIHFDQYWDGHGWGDIQEDHL